jgi:hypothetical protein
MVTWPHALGQGIIGRVSDGGFSLLCKQEAETGARERNLGQDTASYSIPPDLLPLSKSHFL